MEMMDPQRYPPSPLEQSPVDPLPYQSPGAHQKSQWITDDQGVTGRVLVLVLMLLAVIAAVVGPIIALVGMFIGWW
jgi:hypothetical protein